MSMCYEGCDHKSHGSRAVTGVEPDSRFSPTFEMMKERGEDEDSNGVKYEEGNRQYRRKLAKQRATI